MDKETKTIRQIMEAVESKNEYDLLWTFIYDKYVLDRCMLPRPKTKDSLNFIEKHNIGLESRACVIMAIIENLDSR